MAIEELSGNIEVRSYGAYAELTSRWKLHTSYGSQWWNLQIKGDYTNILGNGRTNIKFKCTQAGTWKYFRIVYVYSYGEIDTGYTNIDVYGADVNSITSDPILNDSISYGECPPGFPALLLKDGWEPSDGGAAMSYVSATEMRRSGDFTYLYKVGLKVKLFQTTLKYFLITDVTYSGGYTNIKLDGGGVYTLANASISEISLSYTTFPIGYPTNIPSYGSDGWIAAGETWTFGSLADDPIFTLTIPGDLTAKYAAGMRVKLSQTTTKYFIVHAVSYSSPNTTLHLFGGTDYHLANATITMPYYSMVKTPSGWPGDPTKWTITIISSSTDYYQSNPVNSTYYNLGSLTCVFPIGAWNCICLQHGKVTTATTGANMDIEMTWDTTSNGTGNAYFGLYRRDIALTGILWAEDWRWIYEVVSFTAKTTLYLLAVTWVSNMTEIRSGTQRIYATSAYL